MTSTTAITKCVLLLSIVYLIDAYPEADADPIAGILKISQHIIHRMGKTPYKRCNTNYDCEEDYQICDYGYCKCPEGFTYTEDHQCDLNGGVGDPCETDTDCVSPHSSCVDGVCLCELGYKDDGNYCFLGAAFGGECEKVVQCPNTETYDCINGHCLCSDLGAYEAGLGCLPLVGDGEACEYDVQCSFDNSECSTPNCQCKQDFQVNAAETDCVPNTIFVSLAMETSDTWDPLYAAANSPEYATLVGEWDTILTGDPDIESTDLDSYIFTDSTVTPGTTFVTCTIELLNPDKAPARMRRNIHSRGKRNAEQESLMNKDGLQDYLIEVLMKKEVKQLREPIRFSMPADNSAMDGFCLQEIDCVTAEAMCFHNACK